MARGGDELLGLDDGALRPALTVACVLSPGPTYGRSHVERLEAQVAAHMAQPYRFVCVDDSPFPGWWAKVSLFEPGRFSGRMLYLDLDVTVVGSLDDLAAYPYQFCAIQDYQFPTRINSSVMAWDAGVADHIFGHFAYWAPITMRELRGDQDLIHKFQPAFTFPRRWCPSYKAHVMPVGRMPDDARVVVFHGRPKPWEIE